MELGDVNGDGHLDILLGEMGQAAGPPPENPDAPISILYGDSTGNFVQQVVFVGQGTLEGKLGDIDNNGRLDIIGNTFRHNAPRMDIWINEGFSPTILPKGGTFSGQVTVSMSSNAGNAIYYTTDGSEPNASSPLYAGPFTLNRTATVKAASAMDGIVRGNPGSAEFVIAADAIPPKIISAYAIPNPVQVRVFFSEPSSQCGDGEQLLSR